MIANETIQKILTAGVQAPSGSNSQPWKFLVKNGVVKTVGLYEKDHPVLNYRNRGTLLAHGALLENIDIAAREYGYAANIVLFPSEDAHIVSEITFTEIGKEKQPLYAAIFERSINRKPYKKTPLSDIEKKDLMSVVPAGGEADAILIEDKDKIKKLAKAISISEMVIFENKELHKLLFEELVWTKEEENEKKSGLFLKTLELNAPQQLLLKFLKRWSVTKMVNKLGFSKMLANGNGAIYASTPAMGIIRVSNTDKSFIEAGRIMERLWLQATAMGLNFSIITGVPFLWQQVFLGNKEVLSEEHGKLVDDSYDIIRSMANVPKEDIPVVVFRVGHGEKPSARSSKKDPDIVFE